MAPNQLEKISEEFEDFAYIVSHDLNAPLRHVKEFTRLLIGARNTDPSNEEKQYVEFLEKSLQRLDRMQEALLTFSRINTRAGPLKPTDCNEIVTQAIKELDPMVSKYCPAIECGPLPTVMAEPKQILTLFVNLIDNALKFHEEDQKRKVHISAKEQGEAYLFEIRDNGIGIPADYHEEVFRLFRRLNPDRYPGIGGGLTIAQKIVHRHGGEILIESEPDRGTSVFFSLPK